MDKYTLNQKLRLTSALLLLLILCRSTYSQSASGACSTNINYTNEGYDYTFSTTNTGTAPYTYFWSDGGNPISMWDTVTTNLAVGTHNICVTVTDANNCTAAGCQTVTTPTCSTSITYTNNGSVYTFSTTNTGVAPYTYMWFDGNVIFNMLDTAISTPLPGIRTICVRVTDTNGCIATACEEINVQTDTCFASLTATHSGNTYTFVVNNIGTAPFSYQWANNGTALPSNAATATVQLAVGGNNVCVTVSDANGCTVTKCREITITGIAEELKAAFNIYPNPMADVMNMEIKAEQDGNIQLTVTDLQGRIMSSETRLIVQGANLLAYNTALWGAGIYQVHIQYGNKRYNAKLVKM